MGRRKRAQLVWHSDDVDPARQFACHLLFEQLDYAALFTTERRRGVSTIRTPLTFDLGREWRTDEGWARLVEDERATFEDWLDPDNPDGAIQLMEMLGWDDHRIDVYCDAMERALCGERLTVQHTSRYYGVSLAKDGRWVSDIKARGKHLHRKHHSEEDAALQVNQWIAEYGLEREPNEVAA